MNVFVLSTGRCGSTTFAEACRHITNYSVGQESRVGFIGIERFGFPRNHIEVDPYLAWFLGKLDDVYGDRAIYIHLIRDREAVAESFVRRYESGVMLFYKGLHFGLAKHLNPLDVCLDYYDTVNSNIALFLKDKSKTMTFHLESAKADFVSFCDLVMAEGDLEKAVSEWDVVYNASVSPIKTRRPKLQRACSKVVRVVRKFPDFIRYAIKYA